MPRIGERGERVLAPVGPGTMYPGERRTHVVADQDVGRAVTIQIGDPEISDPRRTIAVGCKTDRAGTECDRRPGGVRRQRLHRITRKREVVVNQIHPLLVGEVDHLPHRHDLSHVPYRLPPSLLREHIGRRSRMADAAPSLHLRLPPPCGLRELHAGVEKMLRRRHLSLGRLVTRCAWSAGERSVPPSLAAPLPGRRHEHEREKGEDREKSDPTRRELLQGVLPCFLFSAESM